MNLSQIGMKPTVNGLNELDTAVLMEKYTLLLGMINYGEPGQKEKAKNEIQLLEGYIHNHINAASFELANLRLGFSNEELAYIESVV